MTWWQRLWKRRYVESRLDAELRDHFDRLVADHVAGGLSPAEASRQARLEFGCLDHVKEECRDARGTRWVHDSAYDVRLAVRAMARDPWFTAVVTASLALGIGVCSMAFTIIDAYYFGGLPVEHPERMFYVRTIDAEGRRDLVRYPDYLHWRAASPDIEMAAFSLAQVSVGEANEAADRVSGAYVSADLFRLLDVDPAAGRLFGTEDDTIGRPRVALIGHRLWTEHYGSDASLPGRVVLVDNEPTTIVGVMPEGFGFPFQQELWLPLLSVGLANTDRTDRSVGVLVSVGEAQNRWEVESALRAAATHAPDDSATGAVLDVELIRFGAHQVGELRNSPALMLPVTAALVLLIACTNVANLLLARGITRTRELAIRTSVGATRGRIVRQLLVESLLLAAIGAFVGFGLATFWVQVVTTPFFEGNIPYWMTFGVTTRSVLAAGAIAVLSTIIFGVAPALRTSRSGGAAATQVGVRSLLSTRTGPWQGRLVAVQFAVAVIILGGAGLLVSSYRAVLHTDDVIDASLFTIARLILPEDRDVLVSHRLELHRRLGDELATVPGVDEVALASVVPFLGAPRRSLALDDGGNERQVDAPVVAISAGYFDTLGLAVRMGRPFRPTGSLPEPGVAIVNQLFAERYLTDRDPIGTRIRIRSESEATADVHEQPWLTVVGIAPTIRQQAPGGPRPVVYLPLGPDPAPSLEVILRTPGASAGTITSVRTRIAALLDQDVVIEHVRPLTVALRNSRLQPQLIATQLGALGIIALLLSAVGLYAITAHGVGQRRPEIGVRLALGGRPRQIVGLFMRQAMGPIAVGMVVGLVGALGAGRLLRSVLIGTSPTDPVTFVGLSLVLAMVTTVACFIPATRGTRVDPASTLREN